MFQNTFLFLGLVAIGAAIGTMSTRFDGWTRVIFCGLSLVCWAIWSFSALNVQVVTPTGEVLSHSYQSLMGVGVAAFAVMLVALYQLVISTLDSDDGLNVDIR